MKLSHYEPPVDFELSWSERVAFDQAVESAGGDSDKLSNEVGHALARSNHLYGCGVVAAAREYSNVARALLAFLKLVRLAEAVSFRLRKGLPV